MTKMRFLILGGGIAGLTAAETIKEQQPDAKTTIISDESVPCYTRPMLSKIYLRTLDKENILVHDEKWYEDNNIEIILNSTITSIDPTSHTVTVKDNKVFTYDKLIYALGCSSFIPPFGPIPRGVFTVNKTDDIDLMRKFLAIAKHIVVIGGGVIGLEIAWELKHLCPSVTILEAAPRLMPRQLDSGSSSKITELIEKNGIEVHAGVRITGLNANSFGRVESVSLADGRIFEADLVIVSAGQIPRISPAKEAGILCERGVLVDEYMKTSDPDIYAAGSCMQCIPDINPCLWLYSRESGRIAGLNASCPSDKKEKFGGAPKDVLINVMETSLFSSGYVNEDDPDCTWQTICKTETVKGFKVNNLPGSDLHYEKRFYKNNILCGAVLIGNLENMQSIKDELKEAAEHDK